MTKTGRETCVGREKRQINGATALAEVEDCRCLSPLPPASPSPAVLGASSPSGYVPPRQPTVPRLGEAAASPGPSGEFRFHSRRRWPCLLLLPLPHLQLELQFEALAGLGAGREWEWEEGAWGSQRKTESRGLHGGASCAGRPGPEPPGIAGSRGQEGIAGGGRSQEREGGGWTEGSPNLCVSVPPRGKRPWSFMGAGDQQRHCPRRGDSGDPASPGSSLGKGVTSPASQDIWGLSLVWGHW